MARKHPCSLEFWQSPQKRLRLAESANEQFPPEMLAQRNSDKMQLQHLCPDVLLKISDFLLEPLQFSADATKGTGAWLRSTSAALAEHFSGRSVFFVCGARAHLGNPPITISVEKLVLSNKGIFDFAVTIQYRRAHGGLLPIIKYAGQLDQGHIALVETFPTWGAHSTRSRIVEVEFKTFLRSIIAPMLTKVLLCGSCDVSRIRQSFKVCSPRPIGALARWTLQLHPPTNLRVFEAPTKPARMESVIIFRDVVKIEKKPTVVKKTSYVLAPRYMNPSSKSLAQAPTEEANIVADLTVARALHKWPAACLSRATLKRGELGENTISAKRLRAAGFTAKQLVEAGFSFADLHSNAKFAKRTLQQFFK